MNIYFHTPIHGYQVSAGWYLTQSALIEFCRRKHWSVLIKPDFGISDLIRARNVAVHQALKADADVLLTFDADQSTDTETLAALIESPHGVSAAPVPKKRHGIPEAERWNFVCEPGEQVREGDFLRVAAAGAGCMAVKRATLVEMAERNRRFMVEQEPVPELYARDFTNASLLFPEQLSEDYSFCVRARDAGFATWLYVPGRVKHYGECAYEGVLTW